MLVADINVGGLIQNGGVEGNVLTCSCKSTEITTVNRRMLEPIRKDFPCPRMK